MSISPSIAHAARAGALRSLLSLSLLVPLGACMTPPPSTAPATPFEQDVVAATDALTAQWHAQRAGSKLASHFAPTTLLIGPFVNLAFESQAKPSAFARPESIAAAEARQIVAHRLASSAPDFKLVSATDPAERPVDLVLSAGLQPETASNITASGAPKDMTPRQLTLVLEDGQSYRVIARWQGPVRVPEAKTQPTPYAADSPVIFPQSPALARLFKPVPDIAIEASSGPSDGVEMAQLSLLDDAQAAYDAGDYRRALSLFQSVATQSPPLAIRAYNGQYLSYRALGQAHEANEAFKQVIAAGFQARSLGVKLLFMPGQTKFLEDPAIDRAYDFWIQEISAQAAASSTCLEVVGHTSHTGTETFNQGLSLARGEHVLALLRADRPALAARLSASGKGWSENIVGSGTDDARDAVDRRVEFKIEPCAKSP